MIPPRLHLWLLLSTVLGGGSLCRATKQQCAEEIEGGTCTDRLVVVNTTYRWDPDRTRCNIRRVTLEQLTTEFGARGLPPLYHEPIVIHNTGNRNHVFRDLSNSSKIVDSFPPAFEVTLSSSNSFSAHRRTIPLSQYLQETLDPQRQVTPDQLSNETWYLFGETYSDEWKSFLSGFVLPPCYTCNDVDSVALSFGIGNRGSGVQWHVHGPGFSETVWGRKHWILYPPNQQPDFHPDQTSRHWMEYTYTALPQRKRPHECTLHPGEMIYFPNQWHHATINLDVYTAFVSTFTTEHGFN